MSRIPQTGTTTANNNQVPGGENVAKDAQGKKADLPTQEDLNRLLERAVKGDATVLPQLRRLFDESPEMWRGYGDLALHARSSWVQLASGPNLLMDECLTRKAVEMRKEVAGETPSPLEQLLADRVIVGWLQVSYYDSLIAQSRESMPSKVRMLQQLQDAAHRRYLAGIKTLATVRKLLTPARSPIEIATKLAGERSGLRLRQASVEDGVPVVN